MASSRPSGEELLAIAEEGVRRARSKGLAEVEVYACFESSARVEFRGRLGEVQERAEGGVSARVALGGAQGFAGVPGLSAASVDAAVERALLNARNSPVDPKFRHYADPRPVTAPPTKVDGRVAQPDADRILGDAQDAAGGVADQDDVTYLSFQLGASCVAFGVANTRGVASWDQDARESFLCELRVSRGSLHKTSNELGVERKPLSATYDLGALVSTAASRARKALDTKPLGRTVETVVFDYTPTSMLVGPFLDALSVAAAKEDGLVEKVGQRIASERVTLRDSPHRPDGPRGARVDCEGVPTRQTTLVERGVLRDLVTSAYVAHNNGQPTSTGNGYRGFDSRWSQTPRPRLASVEIDAGSRKLDDIVGSLDRAVYVRDYLLGFFTNNPITGDFSTVAPLAYLVEKGEVVQALPPTTVAGNVYRMMESVEDVSRERRTLKNGTFPALRVSGLTCAT